MKKYNKSEIMKKAWEIFRLCNSPALKTCLPYTFSEALKYAWAEAKKAAEKAEKIAEAMKKKIVGFAQGECFVDLTTGIIGGYGTYHNRGIFKKCGFHWKYVGGTAYNYNSNGFAWAGSESAVQALLKNVL